MDAKVTAGKPSVFTSLLFSEFNYIVEERVKNVTAVKSKENSGKVDPEGKPSSRSPRCQPQRSYLLDQATEKLIGRPMELHGFTVTAESLPAQLAMAAAGSPPTNRRDDYGDVLSWMSDLRTLIAGTDSWAWPAR